VKGGEVGVKAKTKTITKSVRVEQMKMQHIWRNRTEKAYMKGRTKNREVKHEISKRRIVR
jgi:hypothetical protein